MRARDLPVFDPEQRTATTAHAGGFDLPQGAPRAAWDHSSAMEITGIPRRAQNLLSGVIANLPLFRHCTAQHQSEIARYARAHHVRKGAVIYRRGERLNGLFAVAFGMVKLALRGHNGPEKVYRLVGPGETFGEPPVFLEHETPVEATALSDSMLVIIPAGPLLGLLERDPSFARSLVANLCLRVENLVLDVEAGSLHDARQRVASYLDSLVEANEAKSRAIVRLAATKTVIASRLGVTKETFSRLLHELAEQGLIAVAKREITLLDRPALVALARGGHVPGES
jgi:CRP/FNR family transcriptional regulator, dissimilatory nitrate respiration regulator